MIRVFAKGVFDVLHVGHLNYLQRARELGDWLTVGVHDDRAVEKTKGSPPVIPLAQRMAILEELRCVDEVVSYVPVFHGPLLKHFKIDVFAVDEEHGNDPRFPDQRRNFEFCAHHGIRMVQLPRLQQVNSSRIRERLKHFWNARAARLAVEPAGVTVLGSFGGDQQKCADATRREVEQIVSAVGNPAGKTLLDLACGDGRLLAPLAGRFRRVTGVDFAGDLLDIARRRLAESGVEATLIQSDVTDFHSDEHFDVVLLSGLLPYLDDVTVDQLVGRLADYAKPDAVVLVRNSVGLARRIDVVNQFSEALQARYTSFYRTRHELADLFTAHGWRQMAAADLFQHSAETAMAWLEFTRVSIPAGDEMDAITLPMDSLSDNLNYARAA